MLTLLLTLVTATVAVADDAPTPPPEEGTLARSVWQVLAQRHDGGCDAVLATGERAEVRDALLQIAEQADMPPWAPVRAAACLTAELGADPQVQPALERWVQQPEWSGLGVAVLGQLDALPEAQAVSVAQVALARTDERFQSRARRAVERSTRPAVQATLVSPTTAER